MEMQDSEQSGESVVRGVVTFVFVGARIEAVESFGGQIISQDREGCVAVFARPSDGIRAAVAAVASSILSKFGGVATGEYDPELVIEAIRRVKSIAATGEPGQVVVSTITRELARGSIPDDFAFHSLGSISLPSGSEVLHLVEHPTLPFRQAVTTAQEPARQRNSFVGRMREMDEVRRMLDHSRIVTVVGQSGLGKSAMLGRLISEIDDDFSDGVAKLDLSPLSQPALVEPALIRLLEAPKLAGEDHFEALKAYLRPRRFLLVLDNAEHLLPEVRRIVSNLAETCPDLAILVGSHRALRIPGESRFQLEGLELPPSVVDWRIMQDYDAIALFVDRAQAVDMRFCMSPEIAADVYALCKRLDGIPLALELAASKTKALSPRQILGRLDDYRFELLKDSGSARPDRQRTLEATIHWGYRSLREESRALLRRLSVFLGAFTVDQAIEVCSDGQLPKESVLASFEELVDSSMVTSSSTSGTEKRFQLLETIAAYSRERLREHGEAPTFQARHRLWCVSFAQRAEEGLTGREQPQWLAHLDACYEDIRNVIEWQLTRKGDAATAIRMLLSIYPFFFARQCLHEGLRLTSKIVKSPNAAGAPELARALNLASILATRIADEESARAYAIASLMEARRINDVSMLARARNSLAFIAQDAGRLVRARRHFIGALRAFRILGEEPNELKLLINVASLETTMKLLVESRQHLFEASRLIEQCEDPILRAMYLQNGAHLSLAERMPLQALGCVFQTVELLAEVQDIQGLRTAMRNAAYAFEMLGEFSDAALFIGASKGIGERVEQHVFEYEAEPFRALTWRTTEALGTATFAALVFEGSQMAVSEIKEKLKEAASATFR